MSDKLEKVQNLEIKNKNESEVDFHSLSSNKISINSLEITENADDIEFQSEINNESKVHTTSDEKDLSLLKSPVDRIYTNLKEIDDNLPMNIIIKEKSSDVGLKEEKFISIDEQWERVNILQIGITILLLNIATSQLIFTQWSVEDFVVRSKQNVKIETHTLGEKCLNL